MPSSQIRGLPSAKEVNDFLNQNCNGLSQVSSLETQASPAGQLLVQAVLRQSPAHTLLLEAASEGQKLLPGASCCGARITLASHPRLPPSLSQFPLVTSLSNSLTSQGLVGSANTLCGVGFFCLVSLFASWASPNLFQIPVGHTLSEPASLAALWENQSSFKLQLSVLLLAQCQTKHLAKLLSAAPSRRPLPCTSLRPRTPLFLGK